MSDSIVYLHLLLLVSLLILLLLYSRYLSSTKATACIVQVVQVPWLSSVGNLRVRGIVEKWSSWMIRDDDSVIQHSLSFWRTNIKKRTHIRRAKTRPKTSMVCAGALWCWCSLVLILARPLLHFIIFLSLSLFPSRSHFLILFIIIRYIR